jgi:putative ABC transport system substrate-binding protein
MRRRTFITFLGGVAAWPLIARAQQPNAKRRVSILLPYTEADAEIQTWMATFVQAFRELSWIDGSNVRIDTHWTTPDVGRINQAAMEVIDRKPHVILANGPLAVASLKQLTSTIPIVFLSVADPVGSGFVASLAQPGGNITGFALGEFTMSGKLPEILKKIALPTPTTIANRNLIIALLARSSQIRTAFANMAWNTGSSSPGDELMTLNTSDVAVWRSSDSRSSLSSRAFSIAITAWAAKFCTNWTCFSVNGRTSLR